MNEIEMLFTDILGCDRVSLYLNKDRILDKYTGGKIAQALKRRALGEPLNYILGKAEFMGLEFKVSPDVLIPRSDTEILVETVLQIAHPACRQAGAVRTPHTALDILEIGTGSGCIAVSLAKLCPQARITAVDISPKALVIARENSRLNGVEQQIDFVLGDLFDFARTKRSKYDLIVSNPPYVASSAISSLDPEVRCQPEIALKAGVDGLDFYRRIIPISGDYLNPAGSICLEVGYGQMEAVKEIFLVGEKFTVKRTVRDYNNIDRVIVGQLPE